MFATPTAKTDPFFILASGSPRRRELLSGAGYIFSCVSPAVDESCRQGELPGAYVQRLAAAKSAAGYEAGGRILPSLGADTAVVLDGRILGKPRDHDDAVAMLSALSGRVHQVLTGIALTVGIGSTAVDCVTTSVQFRFLTPAEIEAYWLTGEPLDKAGAYGIQGQGGSLVAQTDGSYTNVVGLPMMETAMMLASYGIFPSASLMGMLF